MPITPTPITYGVDALTYGASALAYGSTGSDALPARWYAVIETGNTSVQVAQNGVILVNTNKTSVEVDEVDEV